MRDYRWSGDELEHVIELTAQLAGRQSPSLSFWRAAESVNTVRNADPDYIWNSQFLLAALRREHRQNIENIMKNAEHTAEYAGLSKIAAAVQAELRKRGLHEAQCRGHFQPTRLGPDIPDIKAIAVTIGDHRSAAYVKDCFDMSVVDYLAENFFDAYQTARKEIR